MFSLTLKKKREVVKYKRTNTQPCVLLVHLDSLNIHWAHISELWAGRVRWRCVLHCGVSSKSLSEACCREASTRVCVCVGNHK